MKRTKHVHIELSDDTAYKLEKIASFAHSSVRAIVHAYVREAVEQAWPLHLEEALRREARLAEVRARTAELEAALKPAGDPLPPVSG